MPYSRLHWNLLSQMMSFRCWTWGGSVSAGLVARGPEVFPKCHVERNNRNIRVRTSTLLIWHVKPYGLQVTLLFEPLSLAQHVATYIMINSGTETATHWLTHNSYMLTGSIFFFAL